MKCLLYTYYVYRYTDIMSECFVCNISRFQLVDIGQQYFTGTFIQAVWKVEKLEIGSTLTIYLKF